MRQLIIMHGVSGSGKSTQVLKEIKSESNKICSADHYFTDEDGRYSFNPKLLRNAHAWCQARAMLAMFQDVEQVIIDNTNMAPDEWSVYEEFAKEFHQYEVVHVWMHEKSLSEESLDLFSIRNKHGVTRETIERQLSKME